MAEEIQIFPTIVQRQILLTFPCKKSTQLRQHFILTSHSLLIPSPLETARVATVKIQTQMIATQSKLSKLPEVHTLHIEQSIDNYFAG